METRLELLTEELATRWRMSPDTLRIWRSQGRGPSYNKRGGKVTYSIADIEKYEQENKVKIELD